MLLTTGLRLLMPSPKDKRFYPKIFSSLPLHGEAFVVFLRHLFRGGSLVIQTPELMSLKKMSPL